MNNTKVITKNIMIRKMNNTKMITKNTMIMRKTNSKVITKKIKIRVIMKKTNSKVITKKIKIKVIMKNIMIKKKTITRAIMKSNTIRKMTLNMAIMTNIMIEERTKSNLPKKKQVKPTITIMTNGTNLLSPLVMRAPPPLPNTTNEKVNFMVKKRTKSKTITKSMTIKKKDQDQVGEQCTLKKLCNHHDLQHV